jgi:bacterioferritin-associated ferredoxin
VYLCICAAVPETEVRECIRAGARSVEELGDQCSAGTGCGSCHDKLAALLSSAHVAEPQHDMTPTPSGDVRRSWGRRAAVCSTPFSGGRPGPYARRP